MDKIKKQRVSQNKRYRNKNKEYYSEYLKVWRKLNKDKNKQYQSDYRIKNKLKTKARQEVHLAIKSGKLIKKECSCGKKRVEAHHEYYSKPLDIIWLCRSCHIKKHTRTMQSIF